MRFPAGTPSLPLVCGRHGCACSRQTDLDDSEGLEVRIKEGATTWRAFIYNDEMNVIDVLRFPTLDGLIEDVHRAYPRAHFDPED